MNRQQHKLKRFTAGFLATLMVAGSLTPALASYGEANHNDSYHELQDQVIPGVVNMAAFANPLSGSNYRNLSLNPGATNAEMRFTWHSGSPTASLRLVDEDGAETLLSSIGRPLEASWGVGNMGFEDHRIPTRPGFRYYVHQVSVYDLAVRSTYTYTIQWPGGHSAPYSFRTGGGDHVQFLIAGDPQIGTGDGLEPVSTGEATRDGVNWNSTLEVATSAFPNLEFMLLVGDQVQSSNFIAADPVRHVVNGQYRHDRMFGSAVLGNLPAIPVVGNHDGFSIFQQGGTFVNNNANPRLWPMHYNIAVPDTSRTAEGNVFRHGDRFETQFDQWVRWGNVLFLVIDSNGGNDGIDRAMNAERRGFWESAVAENADAEWFVATFHHPMFSVYRMFDIPEIQQIINNFLPVLEDLGFDMILNGHAHVYSRSHQMIGTVPQLNQTWLDAQGNLSSEPTHAVLNPTGIVHIDFNSASGSGFYNVTNVPRPYIATYNQNFHRNFSVADVTPYTFSIRTYQINEDNSRDLVDVYTLVRPDASGNVPEAVRERGLPQMVDQVFREPSRINPITVPGDVVFTVEGLGLPATIGLETNLFNNFTGDTTAVRPPNAAAAPHSRGTWIQAPQAPVVWDLAGAGFRPNYRGEQNLTIRGTVAQLPTGIVRNETPFDVRSLDDMVTRAQGRQQTNYTALTWAQFAQARSNAQSVLARAVEVNEQIAMPDRPVQVEVQVTILPYGVVLPSDMVAWMQLGAQNQPPTPGGMEYYFANVMATNSITEIPSTYPVLAPTEPGGDYDNHTMLAFRVGGTNRVFGWNSGAPTIRNVANNNWGGLLNLGDDQAYWITQVDTTGRAAIEVQFDIRSAPNGPVDWQTEFSLDGTSWTPFGPPIALPNTMWNFTMRRQLPAEANDQPVVYIRWRLSSPNQLNGTPMIANAVHHMRNVIIRSTGRLDQDGSLPEGHERIDVLLFSDFHGHIEQGEPVPENPGAARFVAYMQHQRNQNPNSNNVIIAGGGDEFHGYAVSTISNGNPAVTLMGYLASISPVQDTIPIALGNHEFSFGAPRAREFGNNPNISLLAADLFYPQGSPQGARNEQPSWVEPYQIITFPDHDNSVALVGLMTSTMQSLVNGFNTLYHGRTPAHNTSSAYTVAIANLIEHLRSYYGVGAVVGVTHMPGNSLSMTHIANNLDFDAIVGGHQHVRVQRTVTRTNPNFTTATIPIIEPQHHGRSMGRFSFEFNPEGELVDVSSWLSESGEIAAFSYAMASASDVGHYYRAVAALMQRYIDDTYDELRGPLGPHGIYFSNRDQRDVWVSRLVLDHVTRWAAANDEPTDNIVGISNFGGWRNTGFWPREADRPTTLAELISTMPFENNVLLFTMHGRDLLTVLNSGVGGGGGGVPVRSGVHQVGTNWYVTASGERILNDTSQRFNVIGSNFIFGGLDGTGGDTFAWPGNNLGNAIGMERLDPEGPRVVMQDGSYVTWTYLIENMSPASDDWEGLGVTMIRNALIDSTRHREATPNSDWQAELRVSAVGGTATITAPFAPGDASRNLNIIPQRVTVEATPTGGGTFLGWFTHGALPDATPVSTELVHSFTLRANTHLEARFEGGVPVGQTLAAWAIVGDRHGYPAITGTNSFNARWDLAEGLSAAPGTARLNFVSNGTPRVLSHTPGGLSAGGNLNVAGEVHYWVTDISTLGHEHIHMEWNQRSNDTGPRYFQLEYSTNQGETWHAVGSRISLENTGTGQPANIGAANPGTTMPSTLQARSLPSTANNQPSVMLRLRIDGLRQAGTGANMGAGGVTQIGNIRIWSGPAPLTLNDTLWEQPEQLLPIPTLPELEIDTDIDLVSETDSETGTLSDGVTEANTDHVTDTLTDTDDSLETYTIIALVAGATDLEIYLAERIQALLLNAGITQDEIDTARTRLETAYNRLIRAEEDTPFGVDREAHVYFDPTDPVASQEAFDHAINHVVGNLDRTLPEVAQFMSNAQAVFTFTNQPGLNLGVGHVTGTVSPATLIAHLHTVLPAGAADIRIDNLVETPTEVRFTAHMLIQSTVVTPATARSVSNTLRLVISRDMVVSRSAVSVTPPGVGSGGGRAGFTRPVITNPVTLSFELNGGSFRANTPATLTLQSGHSVRTMFGTGIASQTAGTPVREGYRFIGWRLADERLLTLNTVMNENTRVSAQWSPLSAEQVAQTTATQAVFATDTHVTFTVGQAVAGGAIPFIDPVTGRTMVPVRALAESLHATVHWEATTRTVTIHGQNHEVIVLVIDQPLPDDMGTPVIVNDFTFLPARYIAEQLDAYVSWIADTQTVEILI